jgi:hypothetical protein
VVEITISGPFLSFTATDGFAAPMKRVSVAWIAEVKPHGGVHALLGMGGARSSSVILHLLEKIF